MECYGNAPCGMFAVVTGSRGARRGVTAGTDWVVAGSLGAWVSCSDRLISKAKASVSGGTIRGPCITGTWAREAWGASSKGRVALRGWSHGVGVVSG